MADLSYDEAVTALQAQIMSSAPPPVQGSSGTTFPVPAQPSDAVQIAQTNAQFGFLSSLVTGLTGAGGAIGAAALKGNPSAPPVILGRTGTQPAPAPASKIPSWLLPVGAAGAAVLAWFALRGRTRRNPSRKRSKSRAKKKR